MERSLLELAAGIVKSQASLNTLSPEEIESALAQTYNALYRMQRAEEEGNFFPSDGSHGTITTESQKQGPAIDPLSSICENKIICLECGAEVKQLTANHLSIHGLTPREYRKKWGFRLKQPLSAKSLTRLRSNVGKSRGLPDTLKAFQEEQRRKKLESMQEATTVTTVETSSPLPEMAVMAAEPQEMPEIKGRRSRKKSSE